MGDLIVKAFANYIKSHPEVLEKLIEKVVQAILDHLSTPAA